MKGMKDLKNIRKSVLLVFHEDLSEIVPTKKH
jgi:hypothetical protein